MDVLVSGNVECLTSIVNDHRTLLRYNVTANRHTTTYNNVPFRDDTTCDRRIIVNDYALTDDISIDLIVPAYANRPVALCMGRDDATVTYGNRFRSV